MLSDFRKKDFEGKIHTFGFFKGGATWLLDIMARRTQNDKWDKPVHKIYMDWLQKNFWDTGLYKTNAIDELTFGSNVQSDKINVWIFWYQGWESAPQVVKNCRRSTEKYLDKDKYNVHYLTKENYNDFVIFPKWIMDKVSAGTFNLTKFSDFLRTVLLYQFGGIWMDATLYLTRPMDDQVMEYRYYTIKRRAEHPMFCISRHQWAAFFVATNQCKTKFYQELLTLQMEYWRKYDHAFDYLLIDYLMALILFNEPDLSKEWSSIPGNNVDTLFIEHSLNRRFDSAEWEKIKKDTGIFKLTYKMPLSDDPDTFYNRIVNSIENNN